MPSGNPASSIQQAKDLAAKEGIFTGISGGATLAGALNIAKTFSTTTTPIHTVILNLLYTLGTIQPGRWHMTIHYIFYNYRIS